jgi:hypothetical protein
MIIVINDRGNKKRKKGEYVLNCKENKRQILKRNWFNNNYNNVLFFQQTGVYEGNKIKYLI